MHAALLRRVRFALTAIAAVVVLAHSAHAQAPTSLDAIESRIDREKNDHECASAFSSSVYVLRERLATLGPYAPKTLDALRRVGHVLSEMGDWELASGVWRFYLDVSTEALGPCHPRVIEALSEYGAASKGVSLVAANDRYQQLQAILLLDPADPDVARMRAMAVRSLGYYYLRTDRDRSIDMQEEALSLLEGQPAESFEVARTRAWLGWTLLQVGRHDEALTLLARARYDLDRLGLSGSRLAGTIDVTLADLDMVEHRWRLAETRYRAAIEKLEGGQRNSVTRFGLGTVHGYNLLALAQLKQGRETEAWQSLQRYRGQTAGRLQVLNECGQESPQAWDELCSARRRVVEHRALRRYQEGHGSSSTLDWDLVLEELEANAHLVELETAYLKRAPDAPVALEQLQSVLPKTWAYLGWLDARAGDNIPGRSPRILDSRWIYVIRSSGPIVWIPLWEFSSASEQSAARRGASDYGALLQQAAAWTLRIPDDPKLARLARALAEQEINPALTHLDGVDHLIVEFFEDHTLWRPLELLVLPDGSYLGDRFVVSYASSAKVFVAARRASMGIRESGRVLAIGDIDFRPSGGAAESVANVRATPAVRTSSIALAQHRSATNGDLDALNRLPQLPYASMEIDRIVASFEHCEVLRGDAATEANVRALFENPGGDFRLVHFATHDLSETQLMQRCALALARRGVDGSPSNDGLVDALEIELGWHVRADLVTLSGCQTATGYGFRRDEPWGLATVFQAMGANSVLASLWKVDDLATAYLMGRFYENLSGTYAGPADGRTGRPMPKADALAEAKRWLRQFTDESGKQPFAHPVYWAGFILMGDSD